MIRRYSTVFFFISVMLLVVVGFQPFSVFADDNPVPMTVAGLGDAIIARKVSVLKDPDFLRFVKLIQGVDCAWTNCEVPLVEPDKFYPEYRKDVIIGCQPFGADEFKWMGIDFVALGNNHAMDWGYPGLKSTISHLKRVGIGWAGAGANLEEASRPGYIDTSAGRVGQVSFGLWMPKPSMASMPHPYIKGRPGINPLNMTDTVYLDKEAYADLHKINEDIGVFFGMEPLKKKLEKIQFGDWTFKQKKKFGYEATLEPKDTKRIIEAIKIARRNSRVVIVSVHQHMGFMDRPLEEMEVFLRQCIDAGADVVFGHGSHRLWGIEIYKNKPIFYCLGNSFFHNGSIGAYPPETYELFDYPPDTRDTTKMDKGLLEKIAYFRNDFIHESIVPVITFDKGNHVKSIQLHPIFLDNKVPVYQQGTPAIASPQRAEKIIKSLIKLSERYKTVIEYKDGVGTIKLHTR